MHQLNNFLNGYRGNPDILKIPTVRLFFCACWFIYIGLLCFVACQNNIITISSNVSTAHTDRCQRKTNGNFITVLMCFIISCGGRPQRWNSSFSKGYFFNWHACNGDRERCLWRFASSVTPSCPMDCHLEKDHSHQDRNAWSQVKGEDF